MFTQGYIIGLDIGTFSVKMAQFIKKEDGFHLVKVDLREIEKTDTDALREKKILSLLKEMLAGVDIKKSRIIVNVNCPKTGVKRIQAPFMPKSDLEKALALEVKNYFPFQLENAILDFEILGDIAEGGSRKYEVLVAVTPRETVDKYLALLAKAGIKPASFVPSAYAFGKLAEYSFMSSQIGRGTIRAFIDIDELYTELIILKGKSLVFNRKIPIAGRDFTESLTAVLSSESGRVGLSPAEAEKIKREVGLTGEGEPRVIDGKISTAQILSMLRVPLEQLAGEIERCFNYYVEETGGGKIESLVLFGGGASLSGLDKFLSDKLGIEVRRGSPLERLTVEKDAIHDTEKVLHRIETAIGAALTGGKGINLLPPEIKEEAQRLIKRGTLEAAATAFILISALLFIGMRIQLGNFEKRISTAKLELSSLQPQLKETEAWRAANMVLADEPHWEDVFRELSQVVPGAIHFTRLSLADGILKLEGIVASEDGEHLLSDFILTLEKGIFRNVKLIKTKDLKDKIGNEFELECRVA
jgi:type IV pilus assembly protein PilM